MLSIRSQAACRFTPPDSGPRRACEGRAGGSECRAVSLVARRALAAGEAVTLDYGARPLRDMLRGYGFVPRAAPAAWPLEVCSAQTPLPAAMRLLRSVLMSSCANSSCAAALPSPLRGSEREARNGVFAGTRAGV